jgi:hypothetical protein
MEIAIAITLGITEVAKRIGLKERYAPVVALLVGLLSVYLTVEGASINELIVDGITVGLSAMGLWSGTKALAGK